MESAEDQSVLPSIGKSADVGVVFVQYFCMSFVSGNSVVVVCQDGLVCGIIVVVVIVQSANELPESGRMCVECDVLECLYPFVECFMFYVVFDFFVECLDILEGFLSLIL